MGPESAKKVVDSLKLKVTGPMHYYNQTTVLEKFLNGSHRFLFLDTYACRVSKDTLPAVTEILIPRVIWFGREED
jgi:hypothetical protein